MYKKTIDLFENLYGKACLPKEINFRNLYGDYGIFNPYTDEIAIDAGNSCFDSMQKLKKETKSSHGFFLPNESSTLHPACTFVHEFSHAAHKANLIKNGHNAIEVIKKMRDMQVNNVIGRLISRYKLGNNSLDESGGLNEFMAERMSQDICNKLTDNWKYYGDRNSINYTNIFSNKWNCRYSTPQAYLDYYTQQIWNGNILEAKNAVGKIKRYLEEIDRPNYQSERKQSGFWGYVDMLAGKVTKQAYWLDDKNKLENIK